MLNKNRSNSRLEKLRLRLIVAATIRCGDKSGANARENAQGDKNAIGCESTHHHTTIITRPNGGLMLLE